MNDDVLAQILALRERGSTPKQIAKALGLRPAVVAPLIRQAADAHQTSVDPAERTLLDQPRLERRSRPRRRTGVVYCLGVKDTTGPQSMGSGSIDAYRHDFFQAFDSPALPAPLNLAQHLVHVAVAYARGLGFEPAANFALTAPYLGIPIGPTAIRFGREDKPFLHLRPLRQPRAVIGTLENTAGPGNCHYLTHLQ